MAKNILIVGFIILIIQVVFVGLSYTFAVSQFMTPEITGGNNGQETTNKNAEQEVMNRLSKSVIINFIECAAGNPGTLIFTIKNTGTSTIDNSELIAVFDSETVPLTIDSISAGLVSKEISFSKSISMGNHNLIVSAPAGDVQETVPCGPS